MKFVRLTVFCTELTTDIVSFILHEAGSVGEVFDDFSGIKQVLEEKHWDYADAALFEPKDTCSVSGFFTVESDLDTVKSKLLALCDEDWACNPDISFETDVIDSAEWENEWKKYYRPFNIGRVVIIPEWIEHKLASGDVPVFLDPGLAFGTGMHETTSMCIELMQKLDLAGKKALDFGCGSGILGICACKLGAKQVIFADTDEQAITATRNNCGLNGIPSPEVFMRDVRELTEKSDVVFANITADVLCDVEPVIRASLEHGGYAIISGIISQKADAVRDLYCKDLTLVEQCSKNEWRAFLFKL